jgi:hypothetical protein
MLVQLEKIAIRIGQKSGVAEGHLVLGDRCVYFRGKEGVEELEVKIEDATPSDIAIGGQVLLMRNMDDFIRTSPITEIIERTPKLIIFGTISSIYKMDVVSE